MDFEAIIPESREECLTALQRYGNDAALLAGGTDLFVLMKTRAKTPRFVVYLDRIAELKHVGQENGVIRLGATLTHSEVACLDTLAGIDCLARAAVSVGSPQIRNRGTVGGNIVNASPAGDLHPALLVLDASLVLETLDTSREVRLEDFVVGPGMTGIKAEEVLTQVRFRKPADDVFTGFAKIGLRNALAISVANAAVAARSAGGKLKDVRVACGAVAPKPIRMLKVEGILNGETPTEDLISEAGRVAQSECDPLTDIRATREYRRHVTGVIVSRLVRKACERLLGFGNA